MRSSLNSLTAPAVGLAALLLTACGPGTVEMLDPQDPDLTLAPDAALIEPDAGSPDPDGAPPPDTLDAQPSKPDLDRTGCVEGDYLPFRGDLHTHTAYSDGDGTPAAAFKFARNSSGLDFMAVTDHLNKLTSSEYKKCRSAADAADVPGAFTALCGYEAQFSGHGIFLFAPTTVPVPASRKAYYKALAACSTCVGQFNHPASTKFPWPDWSYNKAADARLELIEMAGFALSTLVAALDAGWHVAPVWNSDTHSANWGASKRRTVVFAKQLRRTDLRSALRHHRTNAADDRNATLVLKADGCWMGSTLRGWPIASVTVKASDHTAGDGFKHVRLLGPGGKQLAAVACADKTSCSGTRKLSVTAPTYVFAVATQTDGDHVVSAPIWFDP